MKRFLLIPLLLCSLVVVNAQNLNKLQKLGSEEKIEAIEKNQKSFSAISKAGFSMFGKETRDDIEDLVFNPLFLTNNNPFLEIGAGRVGVSNTADMATLISSTLSTKFKGNKITKIHSAISEGVTSATFWIRKNVNGQNLWEKTITEFETMAVVSVDCDYTVDGEAFFVGCTMNGNFSDVYLFFTENSETDYSFVVGSGGQWQDFSSYGSAFFICETEGEAGLKKEDITLTQMSYVDRAMCGKEYSIVGELMNTGYYPIVSLKAKVEVNGKEQITDIKIENPAPYMTAVEFTIPNIAPNQAGRYDSNFEIIEVNGAADGFPEDNRAKCQLVAMNESYTRKAVMEEITGTWCGWCPRGIVGIENLKRDFPNDFIAIAVHSGESDPFVAPTYETLANAGFGAPSALLNRITLADPYYGFGSDNYGIKDVISLINQLPTEAMMGVSSKLSDNENEIEMTAYTKFSMSSADAPYMVAYVLLEDKLTGVQTNYYSSQVAAQYEITEAGLPEDLKPYYNKKYQYTNKYDDVARGIYDIFGIEGSISGPIQSGVVKEHTITIEVPDNIRNIDNVSVVALLMDGYTGEIIAAEKAYVGESTTTGIESVANSEMNAAIKVVPGALFVTANNATAKLYTTDGKLLSSHNVNGSTTISTKDLNGTIIVRVENGKDSFVKKVAL